MYYFARVFWRFVVVLQFKLHFVFWVIFTSLRLIEVDNERPKYGIDNPLLILVISLKFNTFFFPRGLFA